MNERIRNVFAAAFQHPFEIIIKLSLRGKLVVFLFHDVNDKPSRFCSDNNIWISKKKFRDCLTYLTDIFDFPHPSDLLCANSHRGHKRTAILTFDDCWASIYDAVKICNQNADITPIVFVNGETLEKSADASAQASFDKKLHMCSFNTFQGPLLREREIAEMLEHRDVLFASHLYSHVSAKHIDLNLFIELVSKNKEYLDGRFHEKQMKGAFAFPFGAENINFDSTHLEVLRNTECINYELIFSADVGVNRFSDLKLRPIKRIHVTEDFGTKRALIYLIMRAIIKDLIPRSVK